MKTERCSKEHLSETIGTQTARPAVLPWQDRPAGSSAVVWRYSANPVIDSRHLRIPARVYNSAVLPWHSGYIGVFRIDSQTGIPYLHIGRSDDGLRWEIDSTPIRLQASCDKTNPCEFAYDPRLCRIDDTCYITWCNGYHGPTVGIASTTDFMHFRQHENAFLPFNRNGVLFPRKINGLYAMLSRPSDNGHTPFGDIFYSESPDLRFWGNHRHVMGPTDSWWENVKIGAGPVPIETPRGWLLLYHGVMRTCSGLVYSMGAALLDRDTPSRVRYRAVPFLLNPEMPYENTGLVPNVIFPCAALHDASTGRLAIYYGAADTVTCLAFAYVDELLDFVVSTSIR